MIKWEKINSETQGLGADSPEIMSVFLDENANELKELFASHDISIEKLGLSVRSFNALMRSGLTTVSKVYDAYPEDLVHIRNLGSMSRTEVLQKLEKYAEQILTDKNFSDTAGSDASAGKKNIDDPFSPDCDGVPEVSAEDFSLKKHKYLALRYFNSYDQPISVMNLSVRSTNALMHNHIDTVGKVIEIYPDGFDTIRNLGALSIGEIIEKTNAYCDGLKEKIVGYTENNAETVYTDSFVRETVLGVFENAGFNGIAYPDIQAVFPSNCSEKQIKTMIGKLIAEHVLEYVDFRCYRVYPSFMDSINGNNDLLTARESECLLKLYSGETLESIAVSLSITRERIRQICCKAERKLEKTNLLGCFDEDYYAYLYSTYYLPKEFTSDYLDLPIQTRRYLKGKYTSGQKDLSESLDDQQLALGIRMKIRDYLDRNKIIIDGVMIEENKSAFEDYVLASRCRDEIGYDDFIVLCQKTLRDNQLGTDELFWFSEAEYRTRANRLAASRYCLWKQGERLRYYDIDSKDYTELLETLCLERFVNTEISTLKFMEDYPEIMQQYDIRDQYELHNLLKKLFPDGGFHDMHFERQPVIRFGEYDRVKAYYEILTIVSPVTADEFAEYIRMDNGFDKASILASAEMKQLDPYYHNGVYSIDYNKMLQARMDTLLAALTDDFYYFTEIRAQYLALYADADPDEINPYTLKAMGFRVLSDYVIRNYPSAEAYFRHLLTKDDVFSAEPYIRKYGEKRMFMQIFHQMRDGYEIIRFSGKEYITRNRLEKMGIGLQDITDYCETVNGLIEDGTYFTAQYLRDYEIESKLDMLGFDEAFYGYLLAEYPAFKSQRMFGTIVLYKGQEEFTLSSERFLLYLLNQYESVDIDAFIADCRELYGVCIPARYEITAAIKGTRMYYDEIMNKVYADKQYYYDELDD